MGKVIKLHGRDERHNLRTRYRYAVYERKLVRDGTMAYSRHFIVLKNQYGVIVHFTCFHKYVGTFANAVYRPLTSDTREKLLYVCDMLNYILIDHYESTGVSHVFQINKDMLEAFFRDYALNPLPNGTHKSQQSIEKCVLSVTLFFRKLCGKHGEYMVVGIDQLYNERPSYGIRGKGRGKLTPDFQVRGIPENRRIFRDIPIKVFALLLNQAFKYTPEIAFTICVQAFAGLRPGEAMNLRQESSPLGSGVTITIINGITKSVEFDLTRETTLRSDGIICGRIKKERRQKVYPAFLPAFTVAYERHKHYLRSNKFETAYCPMFVSRYGMAMTYADYRGHFRQLVKNHLRPLLLKHEDAECRLYGQLLYENSLGPHSLRHWFTVMLALMGEDVAQLQYWRGDTSPESALSYLQNKGELMRELSAANERFAEFLMRGVTGFDEK
jgi:integrase